jgi:hypothetical protein
MNRPTTTASNLFRRALCPGSARMEAGLPEEDSDLAREGQLLHDYSAHPEYERKVLKPEQRDLLDRADNLTAIVTSTVVGTQIPDKSFRETTFESDGISGTPDFVSWYDDADVRLVIDRKFGYNIVTRAELNLQLRVYAVITASLGAVGNNVYVAIVQPRVPIDERITIANYTPQDIEDARKQILAILAASNDPDAPLIAGEEQCRYCKAKLICPAFREAMTMPMVLAPDKTVSVASREAYLELRLSECSDEQLEKVIAACRLAAFAQDLIMAEARRRIRAGQLTNFKLGKETAARQVTDVRRAIALLSLAGMAKEDIFDCVNSMALGKLSDVLRKKNPTWNAKHTEAWVNNKLKSVIAHVTRSAPVIRETVKGGK